MHKIAFYHNLPKGGALVAISYWIKILSLKYTIDVYSLSISEKLDITGIHTIAYKYKFIPLPKKRFIRIIPIIEFLNLFSLFLISKKIARDINSKKYDIVVVHPCKITECPIVLRYLKLPSLYYAHSVSFYRVQEPLPRVKGIRPFKWLLNLYRETIKKIDKINIHKATQIGTNSYFMKDLIRKIYALPSEVCYYGVDINLFIPTVNKRKNSVLVVGSLSPVRGISFIIESLALIPSSLRPVLFVIYYNLEAKEMEEELKRFATSKGVKVKFYTDLSPVELRRFYNNVKLTLIASINEPFGLVVLESMACGTPVIAVNEGGFKESIIQGKTGILVNRNPKEFALAISKMLTNEEMRNEFGKNGRDYVVKNWSWEDATKRLEKMLLKIIKLNET
jgi:glycosyltransferase involved in cell wall biosynthesis